MLFLLGQQLFPNHELTPVHNGAAPLNGTTPFWLLGVLVVIISLVVLVRIFYRKNITGIMSAILSLSTTSQLARDENILQQRTSLLLTMIFNLCAALLLWQFGTSVSTGLPFAHTDFARFLFLHCLLQSSIL